MLVITRCFILLLLGYSTSAQNTRCFPLTEGGSLCFTQPNPPETTSWSNALQWCKNIGGTLPIADSLYHITIYGNAVDYFGLDIRTLWLGANSTYNLNDWYWAGGKPFIGTIEHKNVAGKSHAYIMRDGANFRYIADNPWEYHYFICLKPYSEAWCASYSNSLWTGGKCYIKYTYPVTWYYAWYTCGQTGLAVIDDVNDFSKWFEDSQPYWIDLRSTWWTWQDLETGTSFEVTESQFGEFYPDGNSPECLACYKDTMFGYYQWINQNCNNNLQFLCQQYVYPTTIGPSTNAITTFTTISDSTNPPTTESEGDTQTATIRNASTTSRGYSNSDSNSVNYAVPFGVSVGILGALLVSVIVWVALLTSYAYKGICRPISNIVKVHPR